jgi:hypothetical protein
MDVAQSQTFRHRSDSFWSADVFLLEMRPLSFDQIKALVTRYKAGKADFWSAAVKNDFDAVGQKELVCGRAYVVDLNVLYFELGFLTEDCVFVERRVKVKAFVCYVKHALQWDRAVESAVKVVEDVFIVVDLTE